MRTKMKFLILLSIVLMSGKCSDEQKVQVKQPQSLLIILGIDQSLSMNSFPVFTKKDLETISKTLSHRNSDVCICVKSIGNQSDEGFKRITLLKATEIYCESATMSQRAKQRLEIEKIKVENEERIKTFVESLQFERKQMKSCINEFCKEANILLKEPQYSSYKKLVCLYSDGLQDANGDNYTEHVSAKFNNDIGVLTIGWKNKEQVKHIGTYEFTDLTGFQSYISLIN